MKLKRSISILCSAGLLAVSPAFGQTHEDLFRFSNYNWSFGTARSAAMAGAFSSLGADLSSMALNPAGMGMYRRSEIGLSFGYTNLRTRTEHNDLYPFSNSASRDRFNLNNIGAAFHVYSGSGALTSVTFGFAYNKLIDHNAGLRVESTSKLSMGDLFMDQMNKGFSPIPTPEQVSEMLNNRDNRFLGALLAVESGLLTYYDDTERYGLQDKILADGNIYSELTRQTTGSTGQYDLSMGMNFSNRFYLGLGFGLQDIYYNEDYSYFEQPVDESGPDNLLDEFHYPTHLKQNGSAWNFKIGTIFRPIESLRIGLAFHTPTYISIDELYYADMHTKLYGREWTSSESAEYRTNYNLRTPMRLIGGISYSFFNTAILSLDYERVWYNQMKMFWEGFSNEDRGMASEVEAIYKPANNLRAGLEAMVAPNLFARAGFAYYGSMYQDSWIGKGNGFEQYDGRRLHYSAGFGYRNGNWGIDLAYVYMDSKNAYNVFDYNNEEEPDLQPVLYKADRLRHSITATLSVRF